MKPEEFSDLNLYGNKGVFEKRLKEGYTEVAFGSGKWGENKRIVALWVFYHPDGRIATYETPKLYIHGQPFEAEYTKKKFDDYIKEKQISFGQKVSLEELTVVWG